MSKTKLTLGICTSQMTIRPFQTGNAVVLDYADDEAVDLKTGIVLALSWRHHLREHSLKFQQTKAISSLSKPERRRKKTWRQATEKTCIVGSSWHSARVFPSSHEMNEATSSWTNTKIVSKVHTFFSLNLAGFEKQSAVWFCLESSLLFK